MTDLKTTTTASAPALPQPPVLPEDTVMLFTPLVPFVMTMQGQTSSGVDSQSFSNGQGLYWDGHDPLRPTSTPKLPR